MPVVGPRLYDAARPGVWGTGDSMDTTQTPTQTHDHEVFVVDVGGLAPRVLFELAAALAAGTWLGWNIIPLATALLGAGVQCLWDLL